MSQTAPQLHPAGRGWPAGARLPPRRQQRCPGLLPLRAAVAGRPRRRCSRQGGGDGRFQQCCLTWCRTEDVYSHPGACQANSPSSPSHPQLSPPGDSAAQAGLRQQQAPEGGAHGGGVQLHSHLLRRARQGLPKLGQGAACGMGKVGRGGWVFEPSRRGNIVSGCAGGSSKLAPFAPTRLTIACQRHHLHSGAQQRLHATDCCVGAIKAPGALSCCWFTVAHLHLASKQALERFGRPQINCHECGQLCSERNSALQLRMAPKQGRQPHRRLACVSHKPWRACRPDWASSE